MYFLTIEEQDLLTKTVKENPLFSKQLSSVIKHVSHFYEFVAREHTEKFLKVAELHANGEVREAEQLRYDIFRELGILKQAQDAEVMVKTVYDHWVPALSNKIYQDSILIESMEKQNAPSVQQDQ